MILEDHTTSVAWGLTRGDKRIRIHRVRARFKARVQYIYINGCVHTGHSPRLKLRVKARDKIRIRMKHRIRANRILPHYVYSVG